MARIRTIKPEFWTNDKVVSCSLNARLLFIGLWNFADDEGRLIDSPRQIKMRIFPGDDFTATDVHDLLNDLSRNSLIIRYSVEDQNLIQVRGWDHQKINRPNESKLPPPEHASSVNEPGLFSEPHLPEGKGREKERDIEDQPASLRSAPNGASRKNDEAEFECWYAAFPRHVGKGRARKAYWQARKKADAATLLVGVERYRHNKPEYADWCHPATWLNGERWLDEPESGSSGERKPPKLNPVLTL